MYKQILTNQFLLLYSWREIPFKLEQQPQLNDVDEKPAFKVNENPVFEEEVEEKPTPCVEATTEKKSPTPENNLPEPVLDTPVIKMEPEVAVKNEEVSSYIYFHLLFLL